jgi:hypothetical protein
LPPVWSESGMEKWVYYFGGGSQSEAE